MYYIKGKKYIYCRNFRFIFYSLYVIRYYLLNIKYDNYVVDFIKIYIYILTQSKNNNCEHMYTQFRDICNTAYLASTI